LLSPCASFSRDFLPNENSCLLYLFTSSCDSKCVLFDDASDKQREEPLFQNPVNFIKRYSDPGTGRCHRSLNGRTLRCGNKDYASGNGLSDALIVLYTLYLFVIVFSKQCSKGTIQMPAWHPEPSELFFGPLQGELSRTASSEAPEKPAPERSFSSWGR